MIALAGQILEHFEFFNYLERFKCYGNFSMHIILFQIFIEWLFKPHILSNRPIYCRSSKIIQYNQLASQFTKINIPGKHLLLILDFLHRRSLRTVTDGFSRNAQQGALQTPMSPNSTKPYSRLFLDIAVVF